jgi:hypothetical protein
VLKNNGFHNRHSPLPFSPASLFAAGEQGWWYDPSNFATLFQDSAGTTPVTAVEQPVGLQLDLSGRGNHRFQSTSANRPVVSARVNLLTKTEELGNAVWSKSNTTVTDNATIAPDGTTTADLVTPVNGTDAACFQQISNVNAVGRTWTFTFYARCASGTTLLPVLGDDALGNFWSDPRTNKVTVNTVWQHFTVTGTTPAGTGNIVRAGFGGFSSWTTNAPLFIWGADLRFTNQGVNLPVYQRVNTSTDYDTVGFPVYIKPNGSNQFMQTNSINFTATDKMTVWQGVRKLRDTAQSMIAELSATMLLNNGTFLLTAPNSIAANYNFSSKGTTQVDNVVTTYTSPITNVLVGIGDISGSINSVKVNGGAATTVTSSQGTGNYGNYAAYFYMRLGLTLPFNGNDYGSIARGAASTAAQITNGETYINSKTKAY